MKAEQSQDFNLSTVVKARCPACRQRGTFDPIGQSDVRFWGDSGERTVAGQRRCPDPACHEHLFFTLTGSFLVTHPAETLDFDSTNLPGAVISAFEEAVKCHGGQCFVAAAIMVRKTLEELCKDQNANGKNLKERIDNLRATVILPEELMTALHDLRLLGNDAAHIESTEYENVGQEEVELAVEVTKEILKAVYQYSALLEKLRNYKKA